MNKGATESTKGERHEQNRNERGQKPREGESEAADGSRGGTGGRVGEQKRNCIIARHVTEAKAPKQSGTPDGNLASKEEVKPERRKKDNEQPRPAR